MAESGKNFESFQLLTQFKQMLLSVFGVVRFYDYFHNIPALIPQLCSQSIFVIPAEIPHNFFDMQRQIISFPVNGQMFVTCQPNPPAPFPGREGGEKQNLSPLRFGEGQGRGL